MLTPYMAVIKGRPDWESLAWENEGHFPPDYYVQWFGVTATTLSHAVKLVRVAQKTGLFLKILEIRSVDWQGEERAFAKRAERARRSGIWYRSKATYYLGRDEKALAKEGYPVFPHDAFFSVEDDNETKDKPKRKGRSTKRSTRKERNPPGTSRASALPRRGSRT